MPSDKFDVLHQRFVNESNGRKKNLSKLKDTGLFFELQKSGTSKEKRLLIVTQEGVDILTVELNKYGGLSPTKGHGLPVGSALSDNEPVEMSEEVTYILEQERIFYTDINLSSTPGIEVYFRIYDPLAEDNRKIIFIATQKQFNKINGLEIPFKEGEGKKPWELGFTYFRSAREYQQSLAK